MDFNKSAMNYFISSDHKYGDDLLFCENYFKNTRFTNLLDIATATGHFTKPFKADFKVATDISLNMLKIAKNKNFIQNVVLCKAEALPFTNGFFDIVTCRIAMHHFKNPPIFFKETHRILKNEGIFVLIDSIVDTDDIFLNQIERIRDKTHKKSLTILEILQLAKGYFRLISFQNIFKEHNFHEWATRLNQNHETVQKIIKAFIQLPDNIKKELKIKSEKDKIISYTDKKGIFIFQKI